MAETALNLCRVHYDPATGTLWRWDGLLFRPLLDPFVSFDGPTGHVGLAGYKADATNALGVKGTNFLLDNEGDSVRVLFNKKTAADDASFGFETGYSARALIGLLGDDDFHFKVSPDGSTYYEAMVIDRSSGRVSLPQILKKVLSVYNSASHSVLNAWTTVHVDTVVLDSQSAFNVATYRYTPTVAGLYLFSFYGVMQLVGGTYATFGPWVNGSILSSSGVAATITQFNTPLMAMIAMNGSTDYLEWRARGDAGTSATVLLRSSTDPAITGYFIV